jgi:acyl-CoA reductase-like NAD-dependent aldehyde dehydrogenase
MARCAFLAAPPAARVATWSMAHQLRYFYAFYAPAVLDRVPADADILRKEDFGPVAPFGGVRESGLGREGGHEGLLEHAGTEYV